MIEQLWPALANAGVVDLLLIGLFGVGLFFTVPQYQKQSPSWIQALDRVTSLVGVAAPIYGAKELARQHRLTPIQTKAQPMGGGTTIGNDNGDGSRAGGDVTIGNSMTTPAALRVRVRLTTATLGMRECGESWA